MHKLYNKQDSKKKKPGKQSFRFACRAFDATG